MTMFRALDNSVSGANLSRLWMDAIADNIANVNTVRPPDEDPFRARVVIAQSVEGDDGIGHGVRPAAIGLYGGEGPLAYDPHHPLADEDGMVRLPVVDMTVEMSNLILASRTYEANLSVIDRVRDSYMAALRIGNR